MTENPYVRARAEAIEQLKALIEKEQPIQHKRLLGLMGMRGLMERTINSYLDVLQNAGFIHYDGKTDSWRIDK